jgi:hypothetical protein
MSGNARQNTLLATTTGTWSALPTAAASYQWYRCNKPVTAGRATLATALNCAKINRATKSSYKVTLADQSKHLTVLTQAKNKMGSTFSTVKSVLVPKATAPALKSAPKISGSLVKGGVVTLAPGSWSANPTPTTTQQWYRCEKPISAGTSTFSELLNCVKIPSATKSRYTIATADQAKYLTALVSGKNSQGVLVKSAKSVKVPGVKPAAKTSPKISGSAAPNGVLRATLGSWTAIPTAETSLAWYRCATAVPAGATSIASSLKCAKISGANTAQYSVDLKDQGKYLTVLVTAKNSEGNTSSTAKSIYVKLPPALKSAPKVSGTASTGRDLRATDGTWAATPKAAISRAWYSCSSAVPAGATSITSSMGCKKLSGATSSTYKVKLSDEGKYLTVLVTAKNSEGSTSSTAKSIYVKVPVVTP